jgi:hypothetical protein
MAIDSETKREAAAAARAREATTAVIQPNEPVAVTAPKPAPKPKPAPRPSVDKVVEGLEKGIAGLSKEETRLNEILKQEQERLSQDAKKDSRTLTAEQIAANNAAQLLAQQQAQINADNLEKRASAYDLLFTEFNRYGLAALVEPLKGLVQENVSPSEFAIRLQETKAYKDRFAANAQRLANGLSVLSPAEYVALEDQYQEVMRNYGLPSSYYAKDTMGTQVGFQKLLEGDVSSDELKERIVLAQDRVVNASPLVKDALKQFYPDITDGDILAYTLDPTKGLENIKRKVTAAEIGGAAMGQSLKTSASRAEELARFGVTAEAARQGYETIADIAPRGSQLAAIYGQDAYGQAEAEQEAFGLTGSAAAGQRRRKLSELERSAFSGQAGTTAGALGRDRAGSF